MEVFIALISFVLILIIGYAGRKRQIGFGWSLFLGFFFTPLVSLIAVLLSDKIEPDENGIIEEKWGCIAPLFVTVIIIVVILFIFK